MARDYPSRHGGKFKPQPEEMRDPVSLVEPELEARDFSSRASLLCEQAFHSRPSQALASLL